MKIADFKIGTRLTIGFMLVILLTLGVGAVASHQMRALAHLAKDMYDHPLTVGYTMREIRLEIDQMHDHMLRLLFVEDAAEIGEAERNIYNAAARVLDKFAIVEERFLGEKHYVIIAQRAFVDWKNMLDQEIDMLKSGGRNTLDGAHYLAQLKRTNELQGKLQVMIDFASGKARSFRDSAVAQEAHGQTAMISLLGATLLLSLGIAWLITRSIALPLQLIVRRMQEIAKGDLRHDVEINQKDEIGLLAETFREMQSGLRTKVDMAMAIAAGDLDQRVAVNVRDDHLGNAINQMTLALHASKTQSNLQDWIKTGKNELNRIIVGQGDLKVLAKEILGFFASYLKAQIGTLYVLSEEGILTLHGSYAADRREGLAETLCRQRSRL